MTKKDIGGTRELYWVQKVLRPVHFWSDCKASFQAQQCSYKVLGTWEMPYKQP